MMIIAANDEAATADIDEGFNSGQFWQLRDNRLYGNKIIQTNDEIRLSRGCDQKY